ncbi:hypothetical protein [Geomonas azotofigens]|uniref:hypothetical protein n=1 Tax=Geomonas azotofigens TaxID=2843196 RepID=UPI001C10E64F|nr:hypothetical protein [Geomonas azotofigens]MBU5612638.1 hypothetical protein [Geomonas azotofigens]
MEVQKSGLDPRNLGDLLNGIGYVLVKGETLNEITSPTFDACLSCDEVWTEAKRLRDVFTGPAQIDLDFTLGSVVDYSTSPPSRSGFIEAASCQIAIMGGVATIEVAPPTNLTDEQLEKWHADRLEEKYQAKLEAQRSRLEPAFLSVRASKVLELLDVDNPTGEIVYKIYELAEGHPNNRRNFQVTFGITQDQFSRFKDVVHNPTVSGDWARHGYEDVPKTSNPMTKEEAIDFVRVLAKQWLSVIRGRP